MARSYYDNFIVKIIELSEADTWAGAKREWAVKNIEFVSGSSCLCGKHPIKEVVEMSNSKNNNTTEVGNCCVNKFFEIDGMNKMFSALKRKAVNAALIEHSYEKKIINHTERKFLHNVWRKRKLSPKQSSWYKELNNRVMKTFITNA